MKVQEDRDFANFLLVESSEKWNHVLAFTKRINSNLDFCFRSNGFGFLLVNNHSFTDFASP